MAFQIRFMETAVSQYKRIDVSVRRQIRKFLDKLQTLESPMMEGKPLSANLKQYWRYRVGNYRIIAHIQGDFLVVNMMSIGTRNGI